jgi:hypothetical protein
MNGEALQSPFPLPWESEGRRGLPSRLKHVCDETSPLARSIRDDGFHLPGCLLHFGCGPLLLRDHQLPHGIANPRILYLRHRGFSYVPMRSPYPAHESAQRSDRPRNAHGHGTAPASPSNARPTSRGRITRPDAIHGLRRIELLCRAVERLRPRARSTFPLSAAHWQR